MKLLSALLCLALVLAGGSAAAQGRGDPRLEALWEESSRAFDAGRYRAAEAAARKAIDLATARFGPNHRAVSRGLHELGRVCMRTDRLDEGEQLLRRAIAIREREFGPRSAPVAGSLVLLGFILVLTDRFEEAEASLKRAIAIFKVETPLRPFQRGNAQRILALTYARQGRFSEAENEYRLALAELERSLGKDDIWTLRAVRNYATLLDRMGRYQEAEAYYERAIAGLELRTGTDHSELVQALTYFAFFLMELGRFEAADAIFKRALAAHQKAPEIGDALLAFALHGLGFVYSERDEHPEAENVLRQALTTMERARGTDHTETAKILYTLANALLRAGRPQDAEASTRRALEIYERRFGRQSAVAAPAMIQLARILSATNRLAESADAFDVGIAISEQKAGAEHPRLALAHSARAEAHLRAGEPREALGSLERASALLAAAAERDQRLGLRTPGPEFRPRARRAIHAQLIELAWQIRAEFPGSQIGSAMERAFVAAQHAAEIATSAAIAQMAARFSAGDSQLASLLRQAQDLSHRERALDDAVVQKLGTGLELDQPGDAGDRARLQKQLITAREELARIESRIASEFPEYAELTRPKATNIAETQALLSDDEALLTMFVGDHASYVWAVTRGDASWHRLDASAASLDRDVAKLRCGLEVAAWTDPARKARCKELALDLSYPGVLPFDLSTAHQLYVELLSPLERTFTGKRLIIIPAGALTSLPPQVLVRSAPAMALPPPEDYAKADWLIRNHALSVIPTVSSLRALRQAAQEPAAGKPLIGYGAPLFSDRAQPLPPISPGKSRSPQRSGASLAAASEISKSLQPLPETATELERVAEIIGDPGIDVVLGAAATEAHVKRAPLHEYRVVYFATHGLVADEVEGLVEPALALTSPSAPDKVDDGLLTASEVTQLKLNADLVVLSACNTASGSRPGAHALSGLARAFFYAGAKALLVSHWHVYSEAAMHLATGTFDFLKTDRSIGRDEALRRSMLSLIDKGGTETVQPGYWAPLVMVGDGAGR